MHRGRLTLLVSAITTIWSLLTAPPVAAAGPLPGNPPKCPDVVRSPIVAGYPLPAGTAGAAGLIPSPRHPGWAWMIRQHKPAYLYAVHFPGAEAPHEMRVMRVIGVT